MTSRSSARLCERGGLLAKLLLVLVVLFVVGALAWIVLLPSLVAATVKSKTGFTVKVDQLSVNPFTAKVHVAGLVMQNPDGWPEAKFVELRQFKADAEVLSLLSDKFIADEVVVDVAQVTLVKNKAGVLNAVAFKDALTGGEKSVEPPAEKATASSKQQGFLVHHLVLKFDRLVYADYSGKKPATKEYNLNLSRDLTEVDSVTKIISPFTGAALGLVTDTVGGMFKGSTNLLTGAAGTLQGAGKKTGETLKGLMESLEKKKP